MKYRADNVADVWRNCRLRLLNNRPLRRPIRRPIRRPLSQSLNWLLSQPLGVRECHPRIYLAAAQDVFTYTVILTYALSVAFFAFSALAVCF